MGDLNILPAYSIDSLDIPTGNSNYRKDFAGIDALTVKSGTTLSSCYQDYKAFMLMQYTGIIAQGAEKLMDKKYYE